MVTPSYQGPIEAQNGGMVESVYTAVMVPPPGSVVAPHGFPANPRPQGAPKAFLDAMEVRVKVFCDEQKCALEAELDEDDPKSWHWILYETAPVPQHEGTPAAVPVSVLRIVPPPHAPHPNGFEDPAEQPYCKLGRVATMARARGKGLNRRLLQAATDWLAENHAEVGHGWTGNVLAHAQVFVEKVYASQGFVTDERLGRWDDEGIEHLGMWRTIPFR